VKIKARWPRKPVIMLTAFAENIRASGNPLPGVDALLSKPFDLTVFRAVVVATLEK
jgi:DNA-binding response OmpR family regulator